MPPCPSFYSKWDLISKIQADLLTQYCKNEGAFSVEGSWLEFLLDPADYKIILP
jgi:hypothetical protein